MTFGTGAIDDVELNRLSGLFWDTFQTRMLEEFSIAPQAFRALGPNMKASIMDATRALLADLGFTTTA
jgi:hypothetical protein